MSIISNQRSLLHIDDDPRITEMVARRLNQAGYAVESLNEPEKALETLIHGRQRLVLLDIEMPVVNGLDLLHDIKRYDGGIQVIMLTGLVTMTTALQSLRWGAEACHFKPLDDLNPLLGSLESTFRKIDHWWATLEGLAKLRRPAMALQ